MKIDSRKSDDQMLDLAAKGLLGGQMFPEIEEAKKAIMNQPFFDHLRIGTPFDEASRYANEIFAKTLSDKLNNIFIWCSPRLRIRRQPFFGVDKSAPVTIKFRRPVPYVMEKSHAK